MIYDIIVFKNLHFCPSTFKQEAGIFKNLHSGDCFWKTCIFSAQKRRLQGDEG